MLNRLLILTIVGGLLPLGAELWWGLELLTHFRLQFVVIAIILILIAVARKRLRLALLLMATAGINAWPVVPYLPSAAPPPSGETLTLLNLNVNAQNAEHERILALIVASGADLVTLIELSPEFNDQLVGLVSQYPYQLTQPARGKFGLAVLSRFPLLAPHAFELGPTTAIDAEVELPGRRIRLLAVHPVPPISAEMAATRNRQLDQLAAIARQDDEPLVVCGDFNLSPYSPYFARFTAESNTEDVRRGRGLSFSWPSFMPPLGIPIDHCFTRGPLAVESVERMDQIGSDHYPVRVTLQWLGKQ